MREINKISEALFEKIRDRFEDVSLGDENAKATQKPEEARFFNFDYVVDGKNYGNITISLVDEMALKVYFSKNISQGLDEVEKKKWYQFLRELREFSKRNLLSFEPRDITRSTLKQRDIQQVSKSDNTFDKTDIGLSEGRMYGSTKSSYEKDGNTRIIVRHSEAVNPEVRGSRARKINAIFVENGQGERFKLPYNNLRYARAMARHVSEGGSVADDFGQHITKIAEECAKLRPFKNGMSRRTFEDTETQEMVEAAFEYHGLLNNTLKKLSGHKGYHACKESFVANEPLMDDVDIDALKDRFVRRVFDNRLEDALPIVQKAYNMKKENKFAQQFESWANRLTEGTWAIPETDEQIEELKALLSEPLPVGVDATNATGALYNLVGDDRLFDLLGEIAEDDPEEDVSGVTKDWLRNNMPEVFDKLGISDDEYNADVDKYFDSNEELTESGKYWNDPNTNNYNKYWDELVPGSGKSETVEGELLRAATRIYYDYYNNGFGNNWSGALNYLNKYLNTDINNETAILEPYATGRTHQGNYGGSIDSAVDSLVDKVLAQIEAANGQYHPNPHDMFDLQDKEYRGDDEEDDYWNGNEYEYDDEDEDEDLEEGTYGGTGMDAPVVDPNVTEDDTSLNVGVEAYGVKGMKSTPWRKTFKSQAAFEKWLDKTAGDVEVQGTREVNLNDMFKEGEHESTIASMAKAAYIPAVGDKIVTRKGGQIPGTVEKIEERNGIDYVFFRHPEGKLYKTAASNVMRDRAINENEDNEHPAYRAIMFRILRQHPEVVSKHGIDAVDSAVQRECEWVGDVEEIGSSDVSIWVREVISDLDRSAQTNQVNENLSTSLDKVNYKGQTLELEQWPDGNRTISSGTRVLKSGPAAEISKMWANLKQAAKATVSQMSGGVMENNENENSADIAEIVQYFVGDLPTTSDEAYEFAVSFATDDISIDDIIDYMNDNGMINDENNVPADGGPGEWPNPKQKWDRTNPEYEPDEYGNPDSLEETSDNEAAKLAEIRRLAGIK